MGAKWLLAFKRATKWLQADQAPQGERERVCVKEREQMVARAQPAQPAQRETDCLRERERELKELKEQTCNDFMIRHASTVIQELLV
jgi:hypothetical protein